MVNYQQAAEDTFWIGGSDRRLALFENLFPLPGGISYNSYAVLDEKTVLFDTADISIADQYLENLQAVLGERRPDYLVVLHMEPDHCALLQTVVQLYPEVTLVGSAQTFRFISQFFPALDSVQKKIVKEGDVLESGRHKFTFIAAPMVHWPEVLFAYDSCTKALFSADAFGTFGALQGSIFADECDFEHQYLDEARRYYANIVGKFGMQTANVLKKAAALDIERILPLHGPVWRKDVSSFIGYYQKWSTYTPDSDDILVVYASLYGHTASAAQAIAAKIQEKSGRHVHVYDVSKTDVSYLISEVWHCGKIVLASATYNGGLYPKMSAFLEDCGALQVQNRTFALAENGTWAPAAGRLMKAKIEAFKNCTVLPDILSIKSALHAGDEEKLDAFAQAVVDA